MKILRGLRFFGPLVCLCAFSAALWSQVPTGKIYGTVTDEQKHPLPGVTVEAASPSLVGLASAVTEADGVFRLFALAPGAYKITFSLQGFQTVVRERVVVAIEQSLRVDVTLPIGTLKEQVFVVGKPPQIDFKSTVKALTMTRETFEVLPRGRDFDSLVTLLPGVSNEPMLGGISVDGASGLENMFYVDGTDIGDLLTGAKGQNVAFEFVEEVQVKAGGYQAEYGGSMGGVINVITRQGGNAFHGDVTGYLSGSPLTGKARDTLRLDPYDFERAEYINYDDLYGRDKIDRFEAGFSLGGYIFKNRLWFYGSVLPVYERTGRHVVFQPSGKEGDYTRIYQYRNLQAKLTAQPFRFLRLGASVVNNFSSYRGNLPSQSGYSNPDDVWGDYGYSYPNWTLSGFADFMLGNNLLINVRGGSFLSDTNGQRVQPPGVRYSHAGKGTSAFPDIPSAYQRPIGWLNFSGGTRVIDRQVRRKTHADGDITCYLDFWGEHAWKAGASFARAVEDVRNIAKYPVVSLYWGRPAVLFGVNYGQGKYGYYTVSGTDVTGPYGDIYDAWGDRWSAYLQDSWTIDRRLTVNVGLRTEKEFIPNYSNDPEFKHIRPIDFQFGDKLAPRFGFVYDIEGDASVKVFGSYGLYYDVMKLYMAAGTFGGFKYKQAFYSLDGHEWDKIGVGGVFPGTLLKVHDYRAVSTESLVGSIDPWLRPMSQRELSFGVEKQLSENTSATFRFVQKHLRYAVEDVGVLVPEVGEMFYTTNPGYGLSRWTTHGGRFNPVYPETPVARREYWGVSFSLDKRFAGNWLGGLSYTWSTLMGNYSGLANSDEFGRSSPNVERSFDLWYMAYDKDLVPLDGPLATDREHYVKLFGAYTLPFGLTLGAVVNAMSGTPVSEDWYVLSGNFKPNGRGNLGRTPFLWFANVYVEYSVRLGRSSLSFNVNIDNALDIETAQNIQSKRTLFALELTEQQLLSRDWSTDDPSLGFVPHPTFMMKDNFYLPISARLGVRLRF